MPSDDDKVKRGKERAKSWGKGNGRRTLGSDAVKFLAPTTNTAGEAISRFVPLLSDAWAVDDAKNAYKRGDKLEAGLSAAAALSGMGGLAGIFIGPKGAYNIAKELGDEGFQKSQKLAQEMRSAGAADEEIWRTTRTQTGYPTTLQMLGDAPQTELRDTASVFSPKRLMPTYARGIPGRASYLETSFDHPKLYAAYPELRENLFMVPDNIPPSYYGYRLHPEGDDAGIIALNAKHATEGDIGGLETMIHELQHAVDDYEGLPPGANVEELRRMLSDAPQNLSLLHELETANREALKSGRSLREQISRRRSLGITIPNSSDAYDRLFGVGLAPDEILSFMRAHRGSFENKVNLVGDMNPDRAYHFTSGEVKARLAERRLTAPMSPDDYPFSTSYDLYANPDSRKNLMDVPRMLQIQRNPANFERVPRADEYPPSVIPKDSPYINRDGRLVHVSDLPQSDDEYMDAIMLDSLGIGSGMKDGGLVDDLVAQLTDDEVEQMLVDLHPNAPERYATGGLVGDNSLIDPADGLFANSMELINPTNNGKAPLDIPLNQNNLLAKYRQGTPQAQLYKTR